MGSTCSVNEQMSKTPVKTPPVKTPVKSPKSVLIRRGSVPKFSAAKYCLDIDVLKCPICSHVFNSPRVLPCGHSTCIGCLNNLILFSDSSKSRDYFLCPVCQRTTRPSNILQKQKWAAQFPVNVALVRILKNAVTGSIAEKTYRKAFCEICLRNNWTRVTHAFCNNCLEYQCEICAGHHEVTEETKVHEMTWFIPKKEKKPEALENAEPIIKVQIVKPVKPEKEIQPDEQNSSGANSRASDKKVKVEQTARERKFAPVAPIPPVVVSQTITASTGVISKTVLKLGYFDGKAPGDEKVSEFHGIAFLTEGKVALTDFNNKKIKIFDISHKTRVELISDIMLRANPKAICRIDPNTFAAITEREGLYHIRLFTVRDKIQYYVQKSIEGCPIGIGFISKTIICTFRQNNCLHKYRLTRSQQLKTGIIKQDPSGNDLFKTPGVVTSEMINGCPVLYVADEHDFGVTVTATDIIGRRKTSVFFECDDARPKKKVRTADVVETTKSGRLRSRKSTLKLDDTSESTAESEVDKNSKSSGQASGKKTRQSSGSTGSSSAKKDKINLNPVRDESVIEPLTLSLNQTFPKIPSRRNMFPSPKGRHTERLGQTNVLLDKLNVDINNSAGGDINNTVGGDINNAVGADDNKAVAEPSEEKESNSLKPPLKRILVRKRSGNRERVERAETLDRPKTVPQRRKTDAKLPIQEETVLEPVEADDVFERPKTVPQKKKRLYRADGLAVDKEGSIYICMCSSNRVYQTTPDGRVRQDLLSEKDGLEGPKAIAFSPSNNVFLVTCANSNKVAMFRIK